MFFILETGIQPGDIVLTISPSNDWFSKLKRFIQIFPSRRRKHGHMETDSAFVCTASSNAHGIQAYNHLRRLQVSKKNMRTALAQATQEQQRLFLLDMLKTLANDQLREIYKRLTGFNVVENLYDNVANVVLEELNTPRFLDNCMVIWDLSPGSSTLQVLPEGTSLLVFRIIDPKKRADFLREYQKQITLTDAYHSGQVPQRHSLWNLLKGIFFSAAQDKTDQARLVPATETYCSRNVMEVLNQVDPDLVDRGKNVLPKALEAGLRAATQGLHATFQMELYPAAGRDLRKNLLDAIQKELDRMEGVNKKTARQLAKIQDIKDTLKKFHDKYLHNDQYSIQQQVSMMLELLVNLMPILQRQTSRFFKNPLGTASYRAIRHYARTQGIFDGDLREKAKKMKEQAERAEHPIAAEDEAKASEILNALLEVEDEIKEVSYNLATGKDTRGQYKRTIPKQTIFTAVHPKQAVPLESYNRNEVYLTCSVAPAPANAYSLFDLSASDLTNLVAVDYEYIAHWDERAYADCAEKDGIYYKTNPMTLSLDQQWRPLPSCCPEEVLKKFSIAGLGKEDIEIKRNPEDNLHYIRLQAGVPEQKEAKLNYLLQLPKDYSVQPAANIFALQRQHPDLFKILLKYYGYRSDDGRLVKSIETVLDGEKYLAAVRKEKMGSCRLRAIAFKDEMKQFMPHVPVNIVMNPYHAYVELKINGRWKAYCLSGDGNAFVQALNATSVRSVLGCHHLFAHAPRAAAPAVVQPEQSVSYAR